MIIDTNVYSALLRGWSSAEEFVNNLDKVSMSMPVIAELQFGFLKGSKTKHNESMLYKFLSESKVSILLPTLESAKTYSTLQLHCYKKGRSLSQNDVWIAALALEHGEGLVTYDKDFLALKDLFGESLQVLKH